MLKGDVFANQIFENQIFALFIDTFLAGYNGICNGYKNSMAVTYAGSDITISSGAVCIQGRFLEEDTSSTITASTDNSYCKLVIEIDLDKVNTDEEFKQGYYKIIKGANDYPALTQNDIVNNVAGVYQYELARFRAGSSGLTDFVDMRTFIDFNSIYAEIQQHIEDIDSGSLYVQKSQIATLTGVIPANSYNDGIQSVEVDYPSNFTKSNCVAISSMAKVTGMSSPNDIYSEYEGRMSTSLKNDKVSITFTGAWGVDMDYKVVLLKVS